MDETRLPTKFIFSTGIECSYPIIAGPQGRSVRVDELERTFHYQHWKQDFALVKKIGIRYLRYGPPYYRTHRSPDAYDWDFTDQVFAEMQRVGIIPIADLCHFGVPDWAGSFQNPDWPELFARYAAAFATRYPWVRFYTPVNEIYVCAKLSTLAGIWNERMQGDDHAFVTALKHMCRANLLAMEQILRVRSDAVFIQSESSEYFHVGAADAECKARAQFENERRFLSFDLLFSHPPCTDMGLYMLDNGMTRDEYAWFMRNGLADYMILGSDFYERNEQIVGSGGEIMPAGDVFGWSVITRQYFDRYHRPVMHTETNTIQSAVDPARWLWKQFFNVRNLREQGVPVLGFTWYSLLDQVDWDSALALDRRVINPVGLYDLKRQPRPVADAYREMIRQFSEEPLVPNTRFLTLDIAIETGGSSAPGDLHGRPMVPSLSAMPTVPHSHHTVEGRGPLPVRSIVSISRTTDEHLDAAGVESLVRSALDRLGGISRFVKPGQCVLIKPNLTIWLVAETGATTDPRVVGALARIVREAGAGTVQVGECSSCGQVTREIMAITGMEKAAREAGAEPVYFDEVEQVEISVPLGKLIHKIPVPRPLLEADVVIACPKLKTHFLDPVTGALKLWVGAARQDTMHRLHRDHVQTTVADLLTVTLPDLVVMDAIIAGEGNGPVAVRGRFVGCILASSDPVALDRTAADLAGFADRPMSFCDAAVEQGIGIADRTSIDVVGASLDECRVFLDPEQLEGWTESYPARVIAGEGVTLQGTLGHFKGFADLWQKDHIWDVIVTLHGKPTFMIGRAEDPEYEKHLREGRYFVLDDAALDKYKHDPRVVFIPGSPIGNEMMPVIMEALGVNLPGKAAEQMIKSWQALRAKWLYHKPAQ